MVSCKPITGLGASLDCKLTALTILTSLILYSGDSLAASAYLTPELRQQVTLLKSRLGQVRDVAQLRTDANVLWDWANAYALNEGPIPAELSNLVALVQSTADSVSDARLSSLATALGSFVEEMDLLQSARHRLGDINLVAGGGLQADSRANIHQIYTVGSTGMSTGSGLLIAKHWRHQVDLQASDASKPNYVQVTALRGRARFEARTIIKGGLHGGLNRGRSLLFFEIVSGQLAPGDRVTIQYGDARNTASWLLLPSRSTDAFVLPVYVRLRPGGPLFQLPTSPVSIKGGAVAKIEIVAPSTVVTGEPFSMMVIARDQAGNLATGRLPSFEMLLDGTFVRRIAPSLQAHIEVPGLVLTSPGTYRIELRSSGGGIHGRSNPIYVNDYHSRRIFWGDPNGSTSFSDGMRSYRQLIQDNRHIDFIALTEQTRWLDQSEWQTLVGAMRERVDHKPVVFLGFERAMPVIRGGHQRILFRDSVPANVLGKNMAEDLSDLYARLRSSMDVSDVLMIISANPPGDHRVVDPKIVSLVETHTSDGTFEWLPKRFHSAGHQVGITASGDSTNVHVGAGLTAVAAHSGSRHDLFDALKQSRTYATTGARIFVEFTVNQASFGERTAFTKQRLIEGVAIGTGALDRLTVFKNGMPVWDRQLALPHNAAVDEEFKDNIRIRVSFEAASAPHNGQIGLPRQGRQWVGFGQFTNARVRAVTHSVNQPGASGVLINPRNNRRFDFALYTRGSQAHVLLELDRYSEDEVLEINLRQGREESFQVPVARPPAATPAMRQQISLADLKRVEVERSFDVDGYRDVIRVSMIDIASPSSHSFSFTDALDPGHGDYYYLRVKQIDGETAWTSPVWVGGRAAR